MAICVAIRLRLSIGAWWNHQWMYNRRQQFPLYLNPAVGNSFAVKSRAYWIPPPSTPCCWFITLLLHPRSLHSFAVETWLWWLCVAQKMTFHSPYLSVAAFTFFLLPLLQYFLSLRRDGINVLFRIKYSTVTIPDTFCSHISLYSLKFTEKRGFSG